MSELPYDALLVISFGGPEGMDEVEPFLRNVLRGKRVPEERIREVAHHYRIFDGVSPINRQNRELIEDLRRELREKGPDLPIYWGNRNWHPLLSQTLREMAADGIRKALGFVTSAYSSYSGCRQYLEDIRRAQKETGAPPPEIHKLRVFYNHPGFIESNRDRVRAALEQIPGDRRPRAQLLFTAHSIPLAMARGCDYVDQLRETCRLVAEQVPHSTWSLAYQSRSGPPHQPWLEPDAGDHLQAIAGRGVRDVVVSPIGFISDHMEVVFDLDVELMDQARSLGLNLVRAATAGTHAAFVSMVGELVRERTDGVRRRYSGSREPAPDNCPEGCCPYSIAAPAQS
ncbi:MAG: ferrochelatase [Candidatus Aminicenantes bacterium]|nr:ferrochelatase [Candidatus Aminicenantes bacterium]